MIDKAATLYKRKVTKEKRYTQEKIHCKWCHVLVERAVFERAKRILSGRGIKIQYAASNALKMYIDSLESK